MRHVPIDLALGPKTRSVQMLDWSRYCLLYKTVRQSRLGPTILVGLSLDK